MNRLKRIIAFCIALLWMAFLTALDANAAGHDLTIVTDKTPEQLAEWMHPETQHLAGDVVRICAEEGVSAEFVAAVMRYERRPDLHNWFGWSGQSGLMVFDSDLQCLETVIPIFRKNYLDPDGCYYRGTTVDAVAINYNNAAIWRETMNREMERMTR